MDNQEEKMRQLLIAAFEKAKMNDGIWLNESGKLKPKAYGSDMPFSAFNSLVLALHGDQLKSRSNEYITFNQAKSLHIPVKGKETGASVMWYNWNTFINKHNPSDKISRDDFLKLPAPQQKDYQVLRQRNYQTLFNIDQTLLSHIDKERYSQILISDGNKEFRDEDSASKKYTIEDFLQRLTDNSVDIRMDGSGVAHYDRSQDILHLPSQSIYPSNEAYAQDAARLVAEATGSSGRLSRGAIDTTNTEDGVNKERLIAELVAGVKMLEMGYPAKISEENIPIIDYWQRELREDPNLINQLEVSVNKAVDAIHQIEEGNAKAVTKQEPVLSKPAHGQQKHYYLTATIKGVPNKKRREFVIVRDKVSKQAAVILPEGANLQESLPGFSKERIERALRQEGIEDIHFYNPDGSHGFQREDSFFKDKDVSINKLDNWSIKRVGNIDVEECVKHASDANFQNIYMMREDEGKYALILKPENETAFSVYPSKEEISTFFAAVKSGDKEREKEMRLNLARKYYAESQTNVAIKHDPFATAEKDIDQNLLDRVVIFKTKASENKPSKILCLPTISGVDDVEPREVSKSQWQLMWLADDKNSYKNNLATTLFADILRDQQAKRQQINNHIRKSPRPIKAVQEQIALLNDRYAKAVKRGDNHAATRLFNEALRITAVAGITPYTTYENNYLKVRKDAHDLKVKDSEAITRTAERLAPMIPKDAVLIPIPSHDGKANDMLALAEAISTITHSEVKDILRSEPRKSQYEAKRNGRPLMPSDLNIISTKTVPMTKIPILIDNVIDTGATAEAAVQAVGRGIVVSLASTSSTYRQAVRMDETGAIAKKDDNLILLSERFQRLSEKVQKEKDEAEKKEAERKQAEAKKQEEEKRRNSPEQKAKEEREEKAKEELTKAETKAVAAVVLTPILKQYNDLKAKHPDALLLFRGGDFYHTYNDDARKASSILGITLTRRHEADGKTIDMAGFPYTQLDTFLPKLIRAGQRVAICDQLESPRQQAQHQQSELPAAIEQSELEPEAVEEDNRPRRSR